MSEHTPGPWKVLSKWNDRVNGRLICEKNGDNAIAAAFYLGGTEQATVNARLIAAAPDLLEALRDLLAVITNDALIPETVSYMQQARTAIDKASGS